MTDQSSPLPSERREYTRVMLRANGRLTAPNGESFKVRALDISAGGVAAVAQSNLKEGSVFRINLPLPLRPQGTIALEADVEVMHSIFSNQEDGFKLGLRFTKLEQKASSAIMAFVKSSLSS